MTRPSSVSSAVDRGVAAVSPWAATALGATRLPLPPRITSTLRGRARSPHAVVGAPQASSRGLTIPIRTSGHVERLHVGLPGGVIPHGDLIAVAVTTLLAGRHERIHFEFEVSERVVEAVAERTGSAVTVTGFGTERRPGRRVGLAFSGGMDSMAAWLLDPSDVARVSVDFGAWFRRESRSYRPTDPDVVVPTDLRTKGYATNDWLFMGAALVLLADHLDLGWIGFGATFESSRSAFHREGWSPPRTGTSPLPEIIGAVGLEGYVPTRGITEFGGSLVVDRFRPDLVDASLRSVARRGTEKSFRKRLAYDLAIAFRDGHDVDLEHRRLPRSSIRFGSAYHLDVISLAFLAMLPPGFTDRFLDGFDRSTVEAARSIDPGFFFRYNPMFLDELPSGRRATVLDRLDASGVELFRSDDWPEYEKLRRLLAPHHRLPR